MTEHPVPPTGDASSGVIALHGRSDTILVLEPYIELSLDSIGFGRLNVAWRRLDSATTCSHGLPWDKDCLPCIDVGVRAAKEA
jgi:hypothetical protein